MASKFFKASSKGSLAAELVVPEFFVWLGTAGILGKPATFVQFTNQGAEIPTWLIYLVLGKELGNWFEQLKSPPYSEGRRAVGFFDPFGA